MSSISQSPTKMILIKQKTRMLKKKTKVPKVLQLSDNTVTILHMNGDLLFHCNIKYKYYNVPKVDNYNLNASI